ncbi:hypothetical protein OpiT1DRAFT_05304 [Opitutaceae bacterium TAV1]|nr:hypothetical protein OpiT1DRAFT_05304 [Opitutaceae bacterium TAV1]
MTLGDIKEFCAHKLGIPDIQTMEMAGRFASTRWKMIWNQRAWPQTRIYDAVSVPAGQQEVTLPADFELAHAARWNRTGLLPQLDLTAFDQDPGAWDAVGPVAGFSPLAKSAQGYARIRLTRAPAEAGTLYVIGKRKCIELLNDHDTPLLPGVDECLVAFVMGDLEQWQRQFGKAQVFFSEANALLQQMVRIDTEQATQIAQIVPVAQQLEDMPEW